MTKPLGGVAEQSHDVPVFDYSDSSPKTGTLYTNAEEQSVYAREWGELATLRQKAEDLLNKMAEQERKGRVDTTSLSREIDQYNRGHKADRSFTPISTQNLNDVSNLQQVVAELGKRKEVLQGRFQELMSQPTLLDPKRVSTDKNWPQQTATQIPFIDPRISKIFHSASSKGITPLFDGGDTPKSNQPLSKEEKSHIKTTYQLVTDRIKGAAVDLIKAQNNLRTAEVARDAMRVKSGADSTALREAEERYQTAAETVFRIEKILAHLRGLEERLREVAR